MKPVAFDYVRATDTREAIRLLASDGLFAKAVAGSQSLGPMLNLRLAQPDLLVDITAIPEMVSVSESGDWVELGACITHANIEDGRVPVPSNGLLRAVAGRIAYRAVRNRGTIGGSIAHADPAADWISAFTLLGATAAIETEGGSRTEAVENLMLSSFTTSLAPAELIRALRVPRLDSNARWGFYKFSQKAGEFAHAIGAVLHDPSRRRFRAVIGAIEAAPILISDAAEVFGGGYTADLPDRLDQARVRNLLEERGITDEYSRRLLIVALKRAAAQAVRS